MALLAGELARRGDRVALVVYPVSDPVSWIDPNLTLVQRSLHTGTTGIGSTALESYYVARSLASADGRVIVVRTGTPVVGFIALFCMIMRRRFVFSSANDFDFLPRAGASRLQSRIYGFGVRRADAVVVQSGRQLELARTAFPTIKKLVRIPSFADDPPEEYVPSEATEFVWAGRVVDYKRPLLYAELAAAVPEARFVMILHLPAELEVTHAELLTELELRAAQLDNLEIRPGLPHPELVEKLAASVAVVNTSSFEGMPNTYLEAWGRGVPVLALSFDPDGVIAEKDLGIAADGSWDAFVEGARKLWERRVDRGAFAERTRAHIQQNHTIRAVGGQWHDLLESLGAFEPR